MDASLKVVEAAERVVGGFHLDCERFDWGMAHYDRHGRVVPEDFLTTLRGFDAIFLGALGWPARLPDSVTLAPLIQLRQAFGLYANVRPAQTFRGVLGPLRSDRPIDLVVVRENSEGEYVDNGGTLAAGTPDEVAMQSAVHTRRGVERILRFAFHLARTRSRRLAMITKSNAQRHAYGLWDRVLVELAPEFADVAVEKLHIDAATLHLVRRPHTFDVIVGSNLFGDILSDLTGGITGSLGLNPSANLDPERQLSVALRARSRLRAGHRRKRDRQPHGRDPQRRHDARLAGAEPGCGRAAQGGGARVCRRKSDAGLGRKTDHGRIDGGHRRAGETMNEG